MGVPSVDRHTFLERLSRTGLLDAAQLAALSPQLPDTHRGRVIARALVQQGLLTRFQAEQVLAGRTTGFLVGQYRILEQIGQGGMGRVFKAEHRALGRIVALKVLSPRLIKSSRARHFFQREMRTAAQLVHPNIVTALDANKHGDFHYLVMEYVDGPNLEQLVCRQGPFPVGQACEFIRQAAEGLHYAHSKGMVHRDIKPANLLVQSQSLNQPGLGTVKISDFGLARLSRSGTGRQPIRPPCSPAPIWCWELPTTLLRSRPAICTMPTSGAICTAWAAPSTSC